MGKGFSAISRSDPTDLPVQWAPTRSGYGILPDGTRTVRWRGRPDQVRLKLTESLFWLLGEVDDHTASKAMLDEMESHDDLAFIILCWRYMLTLKASA